MAYLWIGLGSALGGMTRYLCYGLAQQWFGPTFPWGTLLVNVAGCGFIGVFATLTAPDGRLLMGTLPRQFVMVGICGGFTTFSSFSLETLNLVRDGEWSLAAGNIAASLLCCLGAVWGGHMLAAVLNR